MDSHSRLKGGRLKNTQYVFEWDSYKIGTGKILFQMDLS